MSPLISAVFTPKKSLTIKTTHGKAFRFLNSAEYQSLLLASDEDFDEGFDEGFDDDFDEGFDEEFEVGGNSKKESVKVSELMLEYLPNENIKVIASLYKNSMRDSLGLDFKDQDTYGREFEVEWSVKNIGINSRITYAHQESEADYFFTDELPNAPRETYSLNLTQSLIGNKLTVGVSGKYVGARNTIVEGVIAPASTVVNANIVLRRLVPNLLLSLRCKDLLQDSPRDFESFGVALPEDQQGWRLEVEYVFR